MARRLGANRARARKTHLLDRLAPRRWGVTQALGEFRGHGAVRRFTARTECFMRDSAVRELLANFLTSEDAHAGFDAAVADIPEQQRGTRSGAHSPWELVEHMRIAQHDILDFSRNRNYREMEWPQEYWPPNPAPPSTAACDDGLARSHETV